MKQRHRLSGFTLIETIVAAAISSVIGLVVVYAIIQSNNVFAGTTFSQQRTSALVEAYNRVYGNVRLAVNFPNKVTIDGTDYKAGATTLIMQLKSIAPNGAPKCDSNGNQPLDTIVYTDDPDSNLVEISDPDPISSRTEYNRDAFEQFSTLRFKQTKNGPNDNRVISMTLGKTYNGVEKLISEDMVARND